MTSFIITELCPSQIKPKIQGLTFEIELDNRCMYRKTL